MESNPVSKENKKLIIQAYTDPEYSKKAETAQFQVILNPESYSLGVEVEYQEGESATSKPQLTFQKIKNPNLDLKFLLDGTIPFPNQKQPYNVKEKVEEFEKVAYRYNGKIHKPNYLHIIWGNLNFKGVLTKMDIQYKLFKPNGEPLRAEISANFRNTRDVKFVTNEEDANSPDLTHQRIIKAGDTLPNLCDDIYGDSAYYLQVALKNKLLNFRNLKPGTKVFFPPIEQF